MGLISARLPGIEAGEPTASMNRGSARSHGDRGFAPPPAKTGTQISATTWIIVAGLVALVAKLVIAFNTIGTNDVVSFFRFAQSLSNEGLERTYSQSAAFNHPPLVAYYLRWIHGLANSPFFQQNNISFPLLLRLPGLLADFAVVLLLAHSRKQLSLPVWALILFALSPVSLMVSGFHGNSDPVMVAFLVAAALMCMRGAPITCGVLLALSCQIKIVPLLMVPIFACFWLAQRRTFHFAIPFASVMALLWAEPLLRFPHLIINNVLAYGSYWGCWGVTYWLRMTGWREFSVISFRDLPAAEQWVMTALKMVIVGAVLFIAWSRRRGDGRVLFQSLGIAWVAFFVAAPGVAPQYMVWLAPFILVLSPSLSAYVMLSSSVFLFFFYNITAGGLPWYLATSTAVTNEMTTPWSLWPWAVLTAALFALYNKSVRNIPAPQLSAPAITDRTQEG